MNRNSIVSLLGLSEILVSALQESPASRRRRQLSHRLGIETLESRMLLNAAPVLAIDQTTFDITTDSPWYIALNSTDADNDAVYYQVEVLEGDLTCELSVGTAYNAKGAQADVSTRNPLWQLTVNQTGGVQGTMLFELFKDRVSNTVSQIMSLTTQNSYDGITFHRIIDGFMSQGGSVYADGTSINGTYYQIDDEFDWNLRHTSTGLLSMAKSSDDTNTSQFFITAERCSWLDFQHSVFGFILDGQEVNEALNSVSTTDGSTPSQKIVISDAELVTNTTYSTLLVRAGNEGTGKIKVTAFDANGNQCAESQVLTLNVTAESSSALPYNPYLELDNIKNIEITQGQTHSFVIPAVDYKGNTYTNVSGRYGAAIYESGGKTALENVVTCDESTGSVKIDTSKLSVGVYELDLLVTNKGQNWYYTSSSGATTDLSDRQTIPVFVSPTKLTSISLSSDDDTGSSSSDGITGKSENLTFVVKGCTKGMTVQLYNPQTGDDQLMGEAVCTDDSGTVQITVKGTFAAGTYNLYAIQVLKKQSVSAGNTVGTVDLASANSEAYTLVVSSDQLKFSNLGDLTSSTLYSIQYGAAFTFDVKTNQEESGIAVTYKLENAPSGMTIKASTGEIAWTPTESQIGLQTFSLVAVDALGNSASQELKINVTAAGNVSSPVIPDSISYTITEGTEETSGTVTRGETGANQILVSEHADLSVKFNATDDDGDAIVWSIFSASSELEGLTINENGTLSWTAGEANGGNNYTVVVMASDQRGGYDRFSFELAVSEVSDSPVFDTTNAQIAVAGRDLTFRVSAQDPDASATNPANAVYYELSGSFTDRISCNNKTGVVTWSVPDDCQPGVYTIQIKAVKSTLISGSQLASIQTITVYVLEQEQYDSLLKDSSLSLTLWSDTDSGTSSKDKYTNFNNSTNDLSLKMLAENLTPQTDLVLYCDGKVYFRDTALVASRTLFFGDTDTASASDFATLSDGVHSFTLAQIILGEKVSFTLGGQKYDNLVVDLPTQASSPLTLTIDSTAPTFDDEYWTPVVNLLEGVDYSDTVQVVDNLTASNEIKYSLSNAPSGMTINSSSGKITWTPDTNVAQTMSYTVTAVDLAGNRASKTVEMSVVLAPNLTVKDQAIKELESWSLELNAEGATEYDLKSGPDGLTLSQSEAGKWTLNWTPTEEQGNGNAYEVSLNVANEQGATRTVKFHITVNEVNQAPVIGALADQLYCREGELFELILSATDVDLPVQDLIWSLDSAPEGMSVNASSGKLTWTPSESQGGLSVKVKINVSDGIDTVSKEVTFTAEEVDDAPVFGAVKKPTIFSALPGQIVQGTDVSMQFSAKDPDYKTDSAVPINAVRYELVQGPAGAAIDAKTGLLTWSTTDSQQTGAYSFVVRAIEVQTTGASTADGLSTDYSFDLVVLPKLALDSAESKTVAEGENFSVQWEANVGNSSERPLTWSLSDAPEGMTINPYTGVISWTPNELQGGEEYSFTVTVTDASGSASQTVVYTCREVDDAPVFDAPLLPQDYGVVGSVMPGSSVEIQMKAADPDVPANSVVYELVEGPEGCSINETTGLLTWAVPVASSQLDVTITVKATELVSTEGSVTNIGLSTEFSFQLRIIGAPLSSDGAAFKFNPYKASSAMELAIGVQNDVLIEVSPRFVGTVQDQAMTQALRAYDSSRIFGIRYGSASCGEIAPPVADQSSEDGKKKKETDGRKNDANQQPTSSDEQAADKQEPQREQKKKDQKRSDRPQSILY